MESINWNQTLRIGRMMAINIGIVMPMLSSVPTLLGSAQTSKYDPDDISLVGIYTLSSKSNLRIYCTDKNTKNLKKLIYITNNGKTGNIDKIKTVSLKMINDDIKNGSIVPGHFENIIGDNDIYFYVGQIDYKIETKNADIGMLLRDGSTVNTQKSVKGYLVHFKDKDFSINCYKSMEGFHAKCIDIKSNDVLAHYYYYLTYEMEPDVR